MIQTKEKKSKNKQIAMQVIIPITSIPRESPLLLSDIMSISIKQKRGDCVVVVE